ncbi:right-handed parallel beta-helix repeat-containing protein [Streptomyces sp. NPDC001118]
MSNVIVSSGGTSGPRGNSILNGSGPPSSATGIDGDWYIDNVTSLFYGPKAAGAWPGSSVRVAAAGALLAANNLSDLANPGTARGNLGLGGAATLNVGTAAGTVAAGNDSRITGAAQTGNNLSDLFNASTARTNLGLGGAATLNVGTAAGTVAAGNDSRITGAIQSGATAGGDLSGALPNPTVAKIQGTAIATPPGTTTQYLRADGTWVNPGAPVINVRDYGAKGDGVTNDTSAINSAITALGAAGGGTLYVPPGTYVTTGLVVQNLSGWTIRGERGSILTLAGNTVAAPNQGAANVLTIADCNDFVIEGITIDGRRDTLFPLVPLATNAAAGQATIQVAHGASAAYVVGQRLNVCGGLTANAGSEANRQDKDLVIQSITPGSGSANDTITFTTNLGNAYTSAAGTLSDGYGPYAAPGAYVTFWQTVPLGAGNTVAGRSLSEEDQQNGLHLINCHRFRVSGCNIHGMWESPIRCGTHALTGSAQNDGCSYGTIANNVLWHSYDQGVGLWCSSNITVTGNVISAAGWAGVCLTVSDDCTISGNVSSDNVQRIPGDTKSGYGVAIEGGARHTIAANKCANNYGSAIYLTAGGTLPFGGPAQIATSIVSASNAVALPAATINLASTAGMATAGQATILTSAGAQQVTYTGITGNQLTGCSGGLGIMYTGNKVTQYPVVINNSGNPLTIGSINVTVSDGTKFQTLGRYSIVDGPRTEKIVVQSIAGNVLTLTAPTKYRHADKCQVGQAVCEDNTLVGNSLSGGNDAGIKLASAVRTTIAQNTVASTGLRGIDLQIWSSGGLQPPYGTLITGNNITAPDTSGDGAAYSAIAATQVSDLQITGNRLSGAAAASVSYVTLYLGAVTDSTVANNEVTDAYGVGIRLDAVNEWVCKRVHVIGNTVLRCLGEGILLWGGDALDITGNTIVNCASNAGPGGFGGGLNIRGVANSLFEGNTVVDNGHNGIGLDSATIQGATVYCTNNVFSGNISRDDGKNFDPWNGAATQQGSGIKELSAGQGPNTYLNNQVGGTLQDWGVTSTGNSVNAVDLSSNQTVAGNKTFSYYTTIQTGQVNGALNLLGTVGFFGATAAGRQTVTGAKGGNAALASLITALAALGLITDNTT